MVAYLSSLCPYPKKAIIALYELAEELLATCLPHQDGGNLTKCPVPFPTAQVNLSVCSPHCPFTAERQNRTEFIFCSTF